MDTTQVSPAPTSCQRLSARIIGSMEIFFYRWGMAVGRRPWTVIISTLIISITCCLGIFGFYRETRLDQLWLPSNSKFMRNTEWLRENFPIPVRMQFTMLEADDVLQPKVMHELLRLHQVGENVSVDGKGWQDICFKIPRMPSAQHKIVRLKRNAVTTEDDFFDGAFDDFDTEIRTLKANVTPTTPSTTSAPVTIFSKDEFLDFGDAFAEDDDWEFDPSIDIPEGMFCSFVESLEKVCFEMNILEIWSYDQDKIAQLTKEDIVEAVNSVKYSPVTGFPSNYPALLGGVSRNGTGHIIKATAVMTRYFNEINFTAIDTSGDALDLGLAEEVDKLNMDWEKAFNDEIFDLDLPEDVTVFVRVWRSFADAAKSSALDDMDNLGIGYALMFIFVTIMLGRCNLVEQRPLSSCMGLVATLMALAVAYGVCSAFSLLYSPVHNLLPFLLLGLGVDDTFVIVQCWNNLPPSDRGKSIEERIALTMRHAGVSITVTSLTDFTAFLIGATTSLPALRSFCIYAALGILSVYILQATFFTAWFTIEQRRIENNRNAIACCIQYSNYKPQQCSQRSLMQEFFGGPFFKFIMIKPIQVMLILASAALIAIGMWGMFLLRNEINPMWFVPQSSAVYQFVSQKEKYYTTAGEEAFLVFGRVNYSADMLSVHNIISQLHAEKDILTDIDEWYTGFREYSNKHFKTDIPYTPLTDKELRTYLSRYLHSPKGGKHYASFKVDGEITCGEPLPPIIASRFMFKFRQFRGPEEHGPALVRLKEILSGQKFTSPEVVIFPYSLMLSLWETETLIGEELIRNLAFAMLCIFICTFVLIANLVTCIGVFMCVVFTLIDVTGLMHFWGITLDTVTCIVLVLAVGLCVDYAAHVGHYFMRCKGSRENRVQQTMYEIAPAVFCGGFSTFISFFFLMGASSRGFIVFFKVFFMVVLIGMFHGIVILPIFLKYLGPDPYLSGPDGEGVELEKMLNAKCNNHVESIYVPNAKKYEDRSLMKLNGLHQEKDSPEHPV